MAVAISKQARELAKANHEHMFQIMLDGRYCDPPEDETSISGKLSKENADKLAALILQYMREKAF